MHISFSFATFCIFMPMTSDAFRKLALSFQDSEENPHFDRTAFKITGRRIFATLHEESGTANLKLTPEDQSAFVTFGKDAVYAVPNKWGVQGWTTFVLRKVQRELMKDALQCAHDDALKKKTKK